MGRKEWCLLQSRQLQGCAKLVRRINEAAAAKRHGYCFTDIHTQEFVLGLLHSGGWLSGIVIAYCDQKNTHHYLGVM